MNVKLLLYFSVTIYYFFLANCHNNMHPALNINLSINWNNKTSLCLPGKIKTITFAYYKVKSYTLYYYHVMYTF